MIVNKQKNNFALVMICKEHFKTKKQISKSNKRPFFQNISYYLKKKRNTVIKIK